MTCLEVFHVKQHQHSTLIGFGSHCIAFPGRYIGRSRAVDASISHDSVGCLEQGGRLTLRRSHLTPSFLQAKQSSLAPVAGALLLLFFWATAFAVVFWVGISAGWVVAEDMVIQKRSRDNSNGYVCKCVCMDLRVAISMYRQSASRKGVYSARKKETTNDEGSRYSKSIRRRVPVGIKVEEVKLGSVLISIRDEEAGYRAPGVPSPGWTAGMVVAVILRRTFGYNFERCRS